MTENPAGHFVVWKHRRLPHACRLDEIEGAEDAFLLRKGVSQAAAWPAEASFAMAARRPHDMLLADNLANPESVIVASERLWEFLAARRLPHVEFLPVTVLDHRRRPLATAHAIVHPTDPVDCLDLGRSGPRYSPIIPGIISELDCLVIDERRVPEDRQLFRCRGYYRAIVVRRDLADAIDAAGFTGIRWTEPHDHPVPRKEREQPEETEEA